MTEEVDKIHIRSEELDEILGRSPNWIIRRGILVIATILFVVAVGSYFYKYPEIVEAPVTVTTYNVPGYIKAKADGFIDTLLVQNNSKINNGQYLAIVHNNAVYEDVMQMKDYLITISDFFIDYDPGRLQSLKLTKNPVLGDIHDAYAIFAGTVESFLFFSKNTYYAGKEGNLINQLDKYKSICDKVYAEISIKKEQMLLTKKQYERDSTLYLSGAISASELEESRSTFLESRLAYQSSLSSLDNTNITRYQLEQSKLELSNTYQEKYKQFLIDLRSEYDALCNAITVWETNYVLKSPIAGKLTFTNCWNKNQNISVGDTVFAVIPDRSEEMVGLLSLSGKGSGKVKNGQAVKIKFDNFPYMEYGIVSARINNISSVPSNNNYIVELRFPEGLKTNYGKVLKFTQQMKGSAEIITEDVRLIERFVNPLRSLWKQQTE